MKVKIQDASGEYSENRLPLTVSAFTDSMLNFIDNITLTSPQTYSISYSKILKSNFGLNSSISLVCADETEIPKWMEDTKSEYSLNITTNFVDERLLRLSFKFKVIDYCGDEHYTNIFYVTVLQNKPPIAVASIPNATFYEGQLSGVIRTPEVLFYDPGDTLTFLTTICYQYDSQ